MHTNYFPHRAETTSRERRLVFQQPNHNAAETQKNMPVETNPEMDALRAEVRNAKTPEQMDALYAKLEELDSKTELNAQNDTARANLRKQLELARKEANDRRLELSQAAPLEKKIAQLGSPKDDTPSEGEVWYKPDTWTPEHRTTALKAAGAGAVVVGGVLLARWFFGWGKKKAQQAGEAVRSGFSWLKAAAVAAVVGVAGYVGYKHLGGKEFLAQFDTVQKALKGMEDMKAQMATAAGEAKKVMEEQYNALQKKYDQMVGNAPKETAARTNEFGLTEEQREEAETHYRRYGNDDANVIRQLFLGVDAEQRYASYMSELRSRDAVKEDTDKIFYARADAAVETYEREIQSMTREFLKWANDHAVEIAALGGIAYKVGALGVGVDMTKYTVKEAAELAQFLIQKSIRHPILSLLVAGSTITAAVIALRATKDAKLPANLTNIIDGVHLNVPLVKGGSSTLQNTMSSIANSVHGIPQITVDFSVWVGQQLTDLTQKLLDHAPEALDALTLTPQEALEGQHERGFAALDFRLGQLLSSAENSTDADKHEKIHKIGITQTLLAQFSSLFTAEILRKDSGDTQACIQKLSELTAALADPAIGITMANKDGIVAWHFMNEDCEFCVDPSITKRSELQQLAEGMRFTETSNKYVLQQLVQQLQLEGGGMWDSVKGDGVLMAIVDGTCYLVKKGTLEYVTVPFEVLMNSMSNYADGDYAKMFGEYGNGIIQCSFAIVPYAIVQELWNAHVSNGGLLLTTKNLLSGTARLPWRLLRRVAPGLNLGSFITDSYTIARKSALRYDKYLLKTKGIGHAKSLNALWSAVPGLSPEMLLDIERTNDLTRLKNIAERLGADRHLLTDLTQGKKALREYIEKQFEHVVLKKWWLFGNVSSVGYEEAYDDIYKHARRSQSWSSPYKAWMKTYSAYTWSRDAALRAPGQGLRMGANATVNVAKKVVPKLPSVAKATGRVAMRTARFAAKGAPLVGKALRVAGPLLTAYEALDLGVGFSDEMKEIEKGLASTNAQEREDAERKLQAKRLNFDVGVLMFAAGAAAAPLTAAWLAANAATSSLESASAYWSHTTLKMVEGNDTAGILAIIEQSTGKEVSYGAAAIGAMDGGTDKANKETRTQAYEAYYILRANELFPNVSLPVARTEEEDVPRRYAVDLRTAYVGGALRYIREATRETMVTVSAEDLAKAAEFGEMIAQEYDAKRDAIAASAEPGQAGPARIQHLSWSQQLEQLTRYHQEQAQAESTEVAKVLQEHTGTDGEAAVISTVLLRLEDSLAQCEEHLRSADFSGLMGWDEENRNAVRLWYAESVGTTLREAVQQWRSAPPSAAALQTVVDQCRRTLAIVPTAAETLSQPLKERAKKMSDAQKARLVSDVGVLEVLGLVTIETPQPSEQKKHEPIVPDKPIYGGGKMLL